MNYQSLFVRLSLAGVCLTLLGCQNPRSVELVWSVRQGLVGQWGIRGNEVFTIGRYLGVYDLFTGRELRRVKLPRDYANITLGKIGPQVAIDDSSLVFGWYDWEGQEGKEGKLSCYDPKTLALRWERSFHLPKDLPEPAPTFSVAIDGAYVYALVIGKKGENLFKLRLEDGRSIWTRAIDKYMHETPILLHDGTLLVRSIVQSDGEEAYGYFQSINADSGETLWRIRLDGLSTFYDPPLIRGDRAYLTSEAVLSNPGHLYTVDLTRGTIIDRQRVDRLHVPFAEHNGTLYFGMNTPAALDTERRQILWQTHLQGPQGVGLNVVALGVLDPSREEIYLGDWERDLYVLSSKTGDVKEKVYIGGHWRGEFFSPLKAFFGSYGVERLELVRGLLFVGTVDKSLFVFRRTEKK